jgi:O-acetyl-ADP-ribose deacetylase (regulator of RNase III)
MATKVCAVVGDITKQEVEAVVNAANKELGGGSGVNGAIRKAGGPEIQKYCEELRTTTHPNGLPAGQSAITPGGKLPAKWIIHTVGPKFGLENGREAELLASCYRTALRLAEERGLKTVAFPAISTGVYGYPIDEAAKVAADAIKQELPKLNKVQEIRLVFVSDEQKRIFQEALDRESDLEAGCMK